MLRPLLLILSLLVMVGVSWLYKEQQAVPSMAAVPKQAPIDYYVKGMELQRMDEQGRLRERLKSDALEYRRQGDIGRLQQPQLWLVTDQGERWEARADHGTLRQQGNNIKLDGAVKLHRPPQGETSAVTLETPELQILTRRQLARTDAAVRIHDAQGELRAVGLRAYLDERRLELLAEVKGNYDQP